MLLVIADDPQTDGFQAALVALLPRLRRYARTLVHETAAADDLVQDTLERAWARRGQWIAGSDLRAWLFAIMHNRRIDLLRADRTVAMDDEAVNELADAADAHDRVEHFDRIDLQRAFDRLGPEHRQVLLLVAVEQTSYEEAAAILSVPIGTVMSRLSRARRRLRDEIGHAQDASDDRAGIARLKRIK